MSSYRWGAERSSIDPSVLELYSGTDVASVARRVLEFAVQTVPCGYAGLTDANGGVMVAVSDPVVDAADRLQGSSGEGPRLLPSGVDSEIWVADLAADVRWPRWGRGGAGLGLRSMFSVKLSARSAGVGTLVLYASVPDWFGSAERSAAAVVVRHASLALVATRRESGLRRLMDSYGKVSRAQGFLMERYGVDAERAFTTLRHYSDDHHLDLTEVADSLLSERSLPFPLCEAVARILMADPRPTPRAAPSVSPGSDIPQLRPGGTACGGSLDTPR